MHLVVPGAIEYFYHIGKVLTHALPKIAYLSNTFFYALGSVTMLEGKRTNNRQTVGKEQLYPRGRYVVFNVHTTLQGGDRTKNC